MVTGQDFSEETLHKVWEKQNGRCLKCNKLLVWKNRGNGERGCWEAHHSKLRSDGGTNHMNNCNIMCCNCHKSVHAKK